MIRGIRKVYTYLTKKEIFHPLPCCNDPELANKKITELLESPNPCMIARFGATELLCMTNYLGITYPNNNVIKYITGNSQEWWWTDIVKKNMQNLSGFFPSNEKNLEEFCKLMNEDMKELNLLGCWDKHESLFAEELKNVEKVHIRLLEPFWSKTPWTKSLTGKKILIVHPFATLIKQQYEEKRTLLFEKDLLPQFDLKVIEAIQSLGGNSNYKSWFDALNAMKAAIDKEDYDICIIGCGAYGFPLAAHVKRCGKKAFHIGGVLQLLFGIKGSRWENPNYGVKEWGIPVGSYSNLINKHWIRPGKKERPNFADKIENACYW